jgi:hypothetical protein
VLSPGGPHEPPVLRACVAAAVCRRRQTCCHFAVAASNTDCYSAGACLLQAPWPVSLAYLALPPPATLPAITEATLRH